MLNASDDGEVMKESTELVSKKAAAQNIAHPADNRAPYYQESRYYNDTQTEKSGYHRLQEYWRSVRKHLWLIAGIMMLVTMLTALYVARQPDIYESKARVQVDLELANNPAVGALKSGTMVLQTGQQDPTYFNTQLQILTSIGLLGRVVQTLDLEHNEAFLHPQSAHSNSTWGSLKHLFGLDAKEKKQQAAEDQKSDVAVNDSAKGALQTTPAKSDKIDALIEKLQGDLIVKQINETRLIEIRYKHYDPDVAAKVTNAIADTFVLSNLERKTETNNTAGDFLQKRIAELQSEIRRGEEELINYGKNHQILSLDASQNTVVERLAGLNRQLLEAENDRKAAEAAYKANLTPGAAEAQAESTSGSVGAADSKILELRQRRAQLLLEYTEKYPEVKEIDQQIALLEKQASSARNRSVDVVKINLETRYRQALQREESLRAAFEKQRAETLTQNEAAVNYHIIQQEIETNKGLLDGLLQRSKENDVILAGTPNNIHIVDHAPLPKGPVGPKRLQAIAMAALLSLIFGVALSRYLDYLDDSVHSTDDVEKHLNLPALAVIPAISSLKRRRFLPSISALQKHDKNGSNVELMIHYDGRSPLAEAYRQLRTSVLLSAAGGAPKTILVTSGQPGEGKTTTAVNTATTLAQLGGSVLLVDGDMRRPRMHSIFNLDNGTGLSSILASEMSEAEMVSLVQKNEESGLHVLPSGPIPPNPAELLGSTQMHKLLAILESSFQYVVIDSPPIASFTDGVLLSSMADGVLLVVHGGTASRQIVRRARQLLLDVGAKIFGVVLNNVTVHSSDYNYYQHQYYDKYYSRDGDEDFKSHEGKTLGLSE